MAGLSHVATPAATSGGSSGGRALVEAPPWNLLDNNGEIVATQGEPEIWRRCKEAGSLDQESLEKKDRAALVVHVTKLEAKVVPGCDVAGVVVDEGDNVSMFSKGDEVYGNIQSFNTVRPKQYGNLTQYTTVEESLIALKPENMPFE